MAGPGGGVHRGAGGTDQPGGPLPRGPVLRHGGGRGAEPGAAWLELDTDVWEVTYHRTEYEIDRAADAIAANELPEHLAKRLYVGQ